MFKAVKYVAINNTKILAQKFTKGGVPQAKIMLCVSCPAQIQKTIFNVGAPTTDSKMTCVKYMWYSEALKTKDLNQTLSCLIK